MVFVKCYRKDNQLEHGVDHVEYYGVITRYENSGWVTIRVFAEVVTLDDDGYYEHTLFPPQDINARSDKKSPNTYWPSSGGYYEVVENIDPNISALYNPF